MAFGSPKPDPRDETIALLKDEILHLRALLDEQLKTNLALMNSYAYRQRYGKREEPETPVVASESSLSPAQLRDVPMKSDISLAKLEQEFNPKKES